LGILWLKTNGVFQNQQVNDAPSQLALGAAASPGDIRFVDVNEDGKIDLDDELMVNSYGNYGFNTV
jgi:hypothetical protein